MFTESTLMGTLYGPHNLGLARTLGQETKEKVTLLQSCVLGPYVSTLISRKHACRLPN